MVYPLPLKVASNWLPLVSLPIRANPALELYYASPESPLAELPDPV